MIVDVLAQIRLDAIRRMPLVKPEALDDARARALQEAHRDLLRSLQDAEPGTEAIAYYGMDMQLRPAFQSYIPAHCFPRRT